METVRNYINVFIHELLRRQERHDQSKLETPEVEIFEKYTPKLRSTTYGSDEYKKTMEEMKVAIDHHNFHNRHHPEYHSDGIKGMNLVDLMELLADWKSATLRHSDGDIRQSIELNQKRFGYSDELKQILLNTAKFLNESNVFNKANES